MADYIPYLVRKLQNTGFSHTLEAQTNLFEIIEQTSGIVLDSTADLNFLNYFLNNDSSLIVNSNNQILLNSQQLKLYSAVRMYYYNPRLLDSLIYNLGNLGSWLDMNDPLSLLKTDSNHNPIGISDKGSLSLLNFYFTPLGFASNNSFPFYLSGNKNFRSLKIAGTGCAWSIENLFSSANFKTGSNMSFSFCIAPGELSSSKTLLQLSSDANSAYLEIYFTAYDGEFTLYVKADDDGGNNFSIDHTFTILTDGLIHFSITLSNTSVVMYLNENKNVTFTVTSLNQTQLNRAELFSGNFADGPFTNSIFDFIATSNYLNYSSLYTVFTYFNTKYFLS